ncbi:MAG TPA: tRNA epoxyqueuosine(34) reductase QueG [Longimicrobiales bacterium]|nr:tRNA epoxyqueuosine(34) reductase QueG [Longimicrobiales bacterium]
MRELTDSIKAKALQLGFDLVGVAEVRPSEHAAFYRDWIGAGRHGEMSYLAREDAVRRRLSPDEVFRSAVVVALNYFPGNHAREGKVARYANGRDYHKVIKPRLMSLLRFIEENAGRALPLARAFVDTGPVLERELARRAGIGWFGRNTMLINPKRGSYFFLGALLLEIELLADAPFADEHCGSCSACVNACPTNALLGRDESGAPVIDATRCISYLTIENRGAIPEELRPLMGDRIFGCDICQEVCPWNSEKFVQLTREPSFIPSGTARQKDLLALMIMDEDEWDVFSRGSAIRRARRAGFLRNVAVALGNVGDDRALPVLHEAASDSEALVREHAAWAIEQIRSRNEGVK